MESGFYKELIKRVIAEKAKTPEDFFQIRRKFCRELKPDTFPSMVEVLLNADEHELKRLKFLQTKPIRTISGVAPIAVMTKPIKCKHGKCIPCPGGPGSVFGNMPQSYTGKEPASLRGLRAGFDPYLQVFNRLEQYTLLNHSFEKAELIVMGGTFPSFRKDYQEYFVKYCFKALNDYSKMFYKKDSIDFIKMKKFFELPSDIRSDERTKRIQKKILEYKKDCKIEEEQKKNEKAKARCIALCLETRPDYCNKKEISQMLRLGATRVEVGVQTIYDDVLKKIERGHTVKGSINATQLLKDSFFKVGYHMMLGLPNSTKEMDMKMFNELFSNSDFMPDALKIYPCMVLEGTKLYGMWKNKEYKPLTTMEAAEIIAESKRIIPKFCRILRVQRDIPSKIIKAGVDRTNLRQYAHQLMKEKGIKCNCIRCREPKKKEIDWDNAKLNKIEYEASNGTEVFISIDDMKNDTILGFCRLRIPYKPFRKEITEKSAGVRELHVYGTAAAIGEEGEVQHRGLGKRLMAEAEKIAKEEFDCNKILVISGIGVREYYFRLKYKRDGMYLSKKL